MGKFRDIRIGLVRAYSVIGGLLFSLAALPTVAGPECGPSFIQDLQEQFMCSNSVELGGCYSAAETAATQAKYGGAAGKNPQGPDAQVTAAVEAEKASIVLLEQRIRSLNVEMIKIQSTIAATETSTVQSAEEKKAGLKLLKEKLDRTRADLEKTGKVLAARKAKFSLAKDGDLEVSSKVEPELARIDSMAADEVLARQTTLLNLRPGTDAAKAAEGKGNEEVDKIKRRSEAKLQELREERKEIFSGLSGPAGRKLWRKNRGRVAQGLMGMEIARFLTDHELQKECPHLAAKIPPEARKFAGWTHGCKLWVSNEQASEFLAQFPTEQLEQFKKHPELCQAYHDYMERVRYKPVRLKGDPICSSDGKEYKATVEINGREYTHIYKKNDNGTVTVLGNFVPGMEPVQGKTDIRTFEIKFDKEMRGGNIVSRNFNFGMIGGALRNVGVFKHQYIFGAPGTELPTEKEMRSDAMAPHMDAKMVNSVGEQIMAVQGYSPAVFRFCAEKQTRQSGGAPASREKVR